MLDDVSVVPISVFSVEILPSAEGEAVSESVGYVFSCFSASEELSVDAVAIVRLVSGLIVSAKVTKGDDSDKTKVDNNKVAVTFCFDIY